MLLGAKIIIQIIFLNTVKMTIINKTENCKTVFPL